MTHKKDLSIIVSVFNEEESLTNFYTSCKSVLDQMELETEIIFINDGSSDGSGDILKTLADKDPDVKVFEFTRNFGHESAMIAGIDHAVSDVAICMDADLQHPPELIPEMYAKYKEGFDVVNMARHNVKKRWSFYDVTSRGFYRIMNHLSPVELIPNASDFFLVSGSVLSSLQTNYRERNRFIRGLVQFLGNRKNTIFYDPVERKFGQSKYSFRKLFNLSFVALVSFSKIPLHLGLFIGFLFGIFSILLGIYSLVMYFTGMTPPGYTTLVLFLSIAFSLQFIMIGIIGIYVGFTFDETKQRPLYIIRK